MKSEKILVLGGTGKTGRKVAQQLQEKGKSVRIGSRASNPPFDWEKPNTWESALVGIAKVYITFQPDLAVPGALEAIEQFTVAAKKEGVSKLVILSGKGEKEAELCEQVVIHSGMDYTVVRASWFNQNFSESFLLDPILQGVVALPRGEAKVPYVDTDDIAEVAVAALLDDAHIGKIYHLTGPEAFTYREVIAEIAKATGREIKYTPISLSAYAQMLKTHGIPEDYVWLIDYLFTEVLGNPQVSEISNDIEKVLKRKPKTFANYVRETTATGIWNPPVPA